ncbi:hypothetical protein L226DRAFT_575407 [Lentinus tigrinus ALCF2SS1-7]|uniref:uncharacterized protein n=1 Tax=Lentinus tigrinus ALCF2SS1-7 TaxID=1328758 RepID=UPI0011661304|nr:hypothetical protein L226DRAFT_575407 [Lentinus tigrinus ALCF2SS1-7]
MTNLTSLALYVNAPTSWILSCLRARAARSLVMLPSTGFQSTSVPSTSASSASLLLYRHLPLCLPPQPLPHPSPRRHPDLARLVRTCSIYLDDTEPAVLSTYANLQRALHLMTNRASLALYSGQKSRDVTLNPPASPAHLPRKFLGRPPPPSPPPPLPIPPTSPSSISSPQLSLYVDLLPTLASRPLKFVLLSGDLTPAAAPSHDVMMPHLRGKFPLADCAPRTDSQLQVLSAMTSASPADLLDSLAISSPNLVCLRLMTTRSLWDLPDLEFYSRIASTLQSLPPLLTAFELTGIHWRSHGVRSQD